MTYPNQHEWDVDEKTPQFEWAQKTLNVSDEEMIAVYNKVKTTGVFDSALHIWDAMIMVIAAIQKTQKDQK